MASDPSFPRTDGSTIPRSADNDLPLPDDATAKAALPPAQPEHLESPLGNDGQEILEDAQTVIRASSVKSHSPANSDNRRQTPAAVAQVLVGQHLDHFRIDALIGGGGMGAVFRAHDEQLDRTVAIKVIPFVGDDPELQRRFRNESQSAAKLDHPQIAKVFGAGNRAQWHYIVFEYVEGTNIRDWVNSNGVLPIDEAVFYTAQLADALQHTADRGIVHRDVKPSNVLISSEGTIKLVDMGLARSENLDLSEDMTASGVTLGTFDYISPEQAQNPRDADLRSDIYSLGCTLYFMLTGSPPYPGGTMLQKLLNHESSPSPNPRELRSEVSTNLAAVIEKMLAKKPARRYQNSADLIADLREVAVRDNLNLSLTLGSGGLGALGAERPHSLLSRLEQHFPWAAAVLLLLVIAGWLHLESAVSRADISIPNVPNRLIMSELENKTSSDSAARDAVRGSADSPFSESAMTASAANGGVSVGPASDSLTNSNLQTESPSALPFPETLSDPQARPSADASRSAVAMAESGSPLDSSSRDSSTSILSETSKVIGAESTRIIDDGDRLFDEMGIEFVPERIRVFGVSGAASLRKVGAGELRLTSLQQAVDIANRYQLEQIELASSQIVSSPLKINTDNMRVFSSVGGTVIEFDSNDVVAMQRPAMCSLGSSIIAFEGVHFVWDVPEGEVDGGSLFELGPRSQTRMSQCTITVNNSALRDEVYAFDYVTDPEKLPTAAQRRSSSSDPFPLVELDLSNVIVRGQMTMIHMDYAARLWLNWDNGLMAVTRYMIDTSGAREELTTSSGPMKLSLSRVTARASAGIGRVRLGVSGSYPFSIYRIARNSVFIVDPGEPQFEFINVPLSVGTDGVIGSAIRDSSISASGEGAVLRMEGSSNAYVVQPTLVDPILRLTFADGQVVTTPTSVLAQEPRDWMDENLPRWNVLWSLGGLPDGPFSLHRPADYRQDETLTPGFDEKSLPLPPLVSRFGPGASSRERVFKPR
ncbi:Serine/threonine-protein kinase PrkC [Rubripirellula amarantea]|uniref:Serine/threonine-protein kinase PrkC n=1 Tax=Rubripirellula amarantea TaxID=2527999 RepID=A0A5C5WSF0_9BACT|nr:serine/threonine-protein kinase [Rubripirellula amarantea]TWT53013.1 Serine/threonine-protein kinase PrkC [Rubripirellula amarantea]